MSTGHTCEELTQAVQDIIDNSVVVCEIENVRLMKCDGRFYNDKAGSCDVCSAKNRKCQFLDVKDGICCKVNHYFKGARLGRDESKMTEILKIMDNLYELHQ